MKSTQTLVLAFVMFGLIGSINFDFPYADEFSAHVNVRNDGDDDIRRLYGFDDNNNYLDKDQDLNEVRVRMFIPEEGIYVDSIPFDADADNAYGKWLYWNSGDDLCDEWVRISVSNDESRRTKYRQIIC